MERIYVPFKTLEGKTLVRVDGEKGGELLRFVTDQGEVYIMEHQQDCCEAVYIEDICGDLQDLVGVPIERAYVGKTKEAEDHYVGLFMEWTFYHVSTRKGDVTLRWYGESNGYYSTDVDFYTYE